MGSFFGTVDKGVVFFLVEEVSVADILVRIVTSHGVGGHLLVCVPEVNVPHIVFIV